MADPLQVLVDSTPNPHAAKLTLNRAFPFPPKTCLMLCTAERAAKPAIFPSPWRRLLIET